MFAIRVHPISLDFSSSSSSSSSVTPQHRPHSLFAVRTHFNELPRECRLNIYDFLNPIGQARMKSVAPSCRTEIEVLFRIQTDDLARKSFHKLHIDQAKEAIKLCTRVIEKYNECRAPIPARCLAIAARIYFSLGEHQTSSSFYTGALDRYGKEAPIDVLTDAACIASQLECYGQAAAYFAQVRAKYGTEVPVEILVGSGFAHLRNDENEKAKHFLNQARLKYEANGSKVPAEVLADEALASLYLGQLEEADDLFKQAIVGYGVNVPRGVIENAANAKLKLGKKEEAAELYHQFSPLNIPGRCSMFSCWWFIRCGWWYR